MFGFFRLGADVESGSHVRRLIHSWTTWNDGRNESFKILEKIFGSETNGEGESSTGGVDEYVVNVNPDDVVEDDYYGMITEEADHDDDQLQKKQTCSASLSSLSLFQSCKTSLNSTNFSKLVVIW